MPGCVYFIYAPVCACVNHTHLALYILYTHIACLPHAFPACILPRATPSLPFLPGLALADWRTLPHPYYLLLHPTCWEVWSSAFYVIGRRFLLPLPSSPMPYPHTPILQETLTTLCPHPSPTYAQPFPALATLCLIPSLHSYPSSSSACIPTGGPGGGYPTPCCRPCLGSLLPCLPHLTYSVPCLIGWRKLPFARLPADLPQFPTCVCGGYPPTTPFCSYSLPCCSPCLPNL